MCVCSEALTYGDTDLELWSPDALDHAYDLLEEAYAELGRISGGGSGPARKRRTRPADGQRFDLCVLKFEGDA